MSKTEARMDEAQALLEQAEARLVEGQKEQSGECGA